MFSYISSFMYGSPVQVSPVQELGQAIQGKFGAQLTSSEENRNETSKIVKLRRTIGKIKNAEGLSDTGLRGQIETAKNLNKEEHAKREQNLASLSGHTLTIMKKLEDEIIESENAAFDDSLEFIRNNFDLITEAQYLCIDNIEAYKKDLEILERDISGEVANSVNDFVQLNLKGVKKEMLDPNYKTASDLEKEFVVIKTNAQAERLTVDCLMDEFEFIDETPTEEKNDLTSRLEKLRYEKENVLIGEEEFVLIQEEDGFLSHLDEIIKK